MGTADLRKLGGVLSSERIHRMPAAKRQMKLGVSMIGLGYHVAAWRHPDVPADGSPDIRHSVEVAQTAERGKLDMVFLADAVGIREYDEPPGALCRFSNSSRFEPITLLAALSMATKHIGLVATLSTTYSEPFHVARQFASLDHLSGGRAGWNVVTSVTPMEAQNFNYDTTPDYDKRYGRAAEFVEVVRGLWDCWEDDAFVRDKASGMFFDPAKMHVLNHKGEHFSVRGPINIPRTPQGYPVIVQAGASEQGQAMAAATADVVFAASASIENAQKYYASVKGRLPKYGRPAGELHIMPGIMAVAGRSAQEAQDKYGALQDLIDPKVGLSQLAASLGDLSAYDLDGPVPEDKINPRTRSRAALMLDMARRNNFTIRQLYLAVAAGNGHFVAVGSGKQIADTMEHWFTHEAAGGVNYVPAALPGGIRDFADLVGPELQRRGLFRTEYEGATLRDKLGLPKPANRHTARPMEKAV
jgi:alkanesulfonate monooxygenase